MYIREINIKGIRSIKELTWKLEEGEDPAGWHVIIGDNGSGKSSFLRAIALTLVGEEEVQKLRDDWERWLRKGYVKGDVNLTLDYDENYDNFSGQGATGDKGELKVQLGIIAEKNGDISDKVRVKPEYGSDRFSGKNIGGERHVWGDGVGWFAASFGPMRRFSGGDREYERIFLRYPKLSRHLSLFDERVALTECLEWLKDLHHKQLDNKPEGKQLELIKKFINQENFLPHDTGIKEVSSDGVFFVDGNGFDISIEDLSDGYRSILSLTIELLRQLLAVYDTEIVFPEQDNSLEDNYLKVPSPGVVLIDEIDVHLHPTWQHDVGWWFTKYFPRMQFIVTTHSPIICHAAESGSVFRLAAPGEDEVAGRVKDTTLKRILYGNILDAYGTGEFGIEVERSDKSKEMLEQLADLNLKDLDEGLTEMEKTKQGELRKNLPTDII